MLPARHHGVEVGHLLITASTGLMKPALKARQVAVLLANVVGTEIASSSRDGSCGAEH